MELRPKGARHSILRDKRAVTHHYNLSNEYFSLFLDESMTYSCAIWSRGATTLGGGAADQARTRLHEAGPAARRARARRRLRLGRVRDPRGARARRARHRDHAERAAGVAGARARGRGGRGRQRGHPRHGLPRDRRRDVRRDRLDRHGRARRLGEHRRLHRPSSPRCCGRAGGCSTTGSRGCAWATPRPARSPSATCSRTPRRCTCRASRSRSSAPGCTPGTSRTSRTTTRARCWSGSGASSPTSSGRATGRRRARARVADLPARVPPGLRERLHVRLPGASGQAASNSRATRGGRSYGRGDARAFSTDDRLEPSCSRSSTSIGSARPAPPGRTASRPRTRGTALHRSWIALVGLASGATRARPLARPRGAGCWCGSRGSAARRSCSVWPGGHPRGWIADGGLDGDASRRRWSRRSTSSSGARLFLTLSRSGPGESLLT